MTDHKNIRFDKRRNRYLLSMMRQKQLFRASFKTLEESIAAKDTLFKFYDENGRLPKRSEIGLDEGYGEYDGLFFINPTESVETCVRCKDDVICKTYAFRSEFNRRGKLCERCVHDTRERKTWSQTNVLNVSYEKKKNRISYRVSIYRRGKRFVCFTRTLDDAVEIRDKVLDFYNRNLRLPDKQERSMILK